MVGLISLLIGALAVGAIVYLTVKLTVSFLKKYKQRKTSKIVAANAKYLFKDASRMSIDELDDEDVVIAEYDEEKDELVQDISIAKDVDERIASILENNGGVVVFE